MKTISKSQYLLLKMRENYETNLKNETVEITDEEYDNLIQYKNIKYDNDNLKGAKLIYDNSGKSKKIENIIYGNESWPYENCKYIQRISSRSHESFYIVFNDGTFKEVYTSELLFKLKNNIGELRKDNEYNFDADYDLYYIYPNKINSNIIQETVIAEYKGLTCEFCDINVYKSDYSFNFENQKIYTGQKPTNFLNEYIDENEYSNTNELRIYIDNYSIRIEILGDNGGCYYDCGSSYIIKNNEIIFLDAFMEHWKIKDFNFSSNNYRFEGYIEYNNETYHFLTAEFEPENKNKNISIMNWVLPKLKFLNTLLIQYDLKSYHQEYCGEIYTEYDIQKQKSRWVAFTFFADSNNYIDNNYNPTQYDIDPNISIENQLTNEQLENCYLTYDKGYLGHKTWFSQIYKNDNVDYYTYISPMYNSFNNKIWKPLMNKLNSWINSLGENDNHELYITIGCTMDNNQILTINNGVYVPKYYYVAILKNNIESAIGFYIEHKEYDENYNVDLKDFIVSIDELEQLTGIDFFCDLPDNMENYLEQFTKEELINMFFNN